MRKKTFSLRVLLLATGLISVCFAWLGTCNNTARLQKKAVEEITGWGGRVEYGFYTQAGGDGKPHGSVILRKWLGPHFFDRVDSVSLSPIYKLGGSGPIHVPNFSDSDIAVVTRLPGLRRLGLSNTDITDDALVHVGQVESLEELILHGTNITDRGVAHLSRLTHLTTLWLHGTDITNSSMTVVADLPNVSSLTLTHTSVDDDGLLHVTNLDDLETLWLSGCAITDDGLFHLEQFGTLKTLWLQETHVSDMGVRHLSHFQLLEQLLLTDCVSVSDASVPFLSRLTNLTSLGLLGTKISSEGISKIQNALPNCRVSGPRK